MTMTLIETKTLGTAAASIEFTSIPQTYTDLFVLTSLRAVDNERIALMTLNGSTANFSMRVLRTENGTVDSFAATSGAFTRFWGVSSFGSDTANTFGVGSIYIPNYTSANFKSISGDAVSENNGTSNSINISAILWSNTAAITSLAVMPNAGNYAIGSTVSLYGILKGSSGGVVVS